MKIFHTLGNPITSGDEVHFRISEGSTATSGWKTVKRILHRNQCQPALPGQEAVCMPVTASGGWVLRLRLLDQTSERGQELLERM